VTETVLERKRETRGRGHLMPAFLERRLLQEVAGLVDKLQFTEYSDVR